MLIHHGVLQPSQKHGGTLLYGENRLDLISCFNQQILRTLLALTINYFLRFLPFLSFNRLFELNSVHSGLTEASFVYHFVSSDSLFFRRVAIGQMI